VFRVFFNSPTQFPPIKQGLSDVLFSLWFHVLEYFQQSYPIPPIKQGLSDVLLFCDSLCLEYFSTVLQFPTYKAGVEWCAALLWFHVLEYFSTVLQFPPMTGDKVMLLSLINVLGIFNSPVSTYEGIKVMLLLCVLRSLGISTVLPNSHL
jgi:hypothetical protein